MAAEGLVGARPRADNAFAGGQPDAFAVPHTDIALVRNLFVRRGIRLVVGRAKVVEIVSIAPLFNAGIHAQHRRVGIIAAQNWILIIAITQVRAALVLRIHYVLYAGTK